jgi:hypothetical protein
MSVSDFEAFKAELLSIKDSISSISQKTLRDENLKKRIQDLFRVWTSFLQSTLEPLLREKRHFLKLSAELESIAKLTSKYKSVTEYKKRFNKAIQYANNIILYLPPNDQKKPVVRTPYRERLFVNGIPDLTPELVPNSLLGWKSRIETFLDKHPFDKSVFIMIKYRKKNNQLIGVIKRILKERGLYGVLASEHNLTDDLYNPIACLICCSRGIVVFDEAEKKQTFNPNVAYELGMMHLLGRDCLILKHNTLQALHSDILMKLYQEYTNITDLKKHINKWLEKNNS